MTLTTFILLAFVAIEHIYFLILEMFMWTKPKGIKAFGLKSKQFAEETKVLAANQGLYNGFLAAGLIFSMIENDIRVAVFFLICVTIARYLWSVLYKTNKVILRTSNSCNYRVNFLLYSKLINLFFII
jgi:putative membrane protein